MTITVPNLGVIGSESLTIDSTAGGKSLTAAQYQQAQSSNDARETVATRALVTVEAQPIRWSINPAVTVTATTNGHYAAALDAFWLTNATEILNFRAIRATGSDGTIRVTYFY